jgi:hypothetical protein
VGDYGRIHAASQADEHGIFPSRPDVPRFQTFNPRKPPPPSSPTSPILMEDMPSLSHPTPVSTAGRFATFPVKARRQDSVLPMFVEPLAGSRSNFSNGEQVPPRGDAEDTAPMYEAIETTHTPPPGPPPGAAPPAMPHASIYGGYDPGSHDSRPPFVPDDMNEQEDDSQLPYMASERKVPFGSRPPPLPRRLEKADRGAEPFEVCSVRMLKSPADPDSIPGLSTATVGIKRR